MRDTTSNPSDPSQATGHTVTLLLIPAGSVAAFAPAWAVLCGAWAAGGWRWKLKALFSSSPNTLIALLLAMFIAEALWSSWRALLIDMDWANYLKQHPLPGRGDPVPQPLYTTPWSPFGRVLKRWSQVRRWMRETLPAERRGALFTLPILPPFILLLSMVVGWQMLVLSLAALSLSLIEWLVARRGRMHTALQAGLQIGLSWLAGHIVFGSLGWSSFTLACCYAIAYQGALSLSKEMASLMEGTSSATPVRPSWSLALLYGGQAAALVLLVLLEHPLAATALGLLLTLQLLLLARLEIGEQSIWYLRRAVPFLMVAMSVAAWAV